LLIFHKKYKQFQLPIDIDEAISHYTDIATMFPGSILADDALSEQDPKTGGWRYKLPWGHCFCKEKHWGQATFIGAIRLNGLSKYYELTGDPRIPDAVRRGVTHMNRDTWEEQYSGWRYTSCPKSSSGPGRQSGVIVMALVNSVALKIAGVTAETEDPRGGVIVRDPKRVV
jgi:hypothetical protein